MDKQNSPQISNPVQSSKNVWIIVISTVVTVFIVSGIIYSWRRSDLKSAEQSLQQQITSLQNQNSQLQQQITVSKEIANKIYNGELYSFQYPENLDITCSGPDAPKGLVLTNNDGIFISITHSKTDQGKTWKEWVDIIEMGYGARVEDVTREEIKINNKDAYKRTMKVKDFFNENNNEVKYFLAEIFIANNPLNETTNRTDKLAELALSIPNEEYQEYISVFDNIVKSFEWK